jgi:hypothetical protein
MGVELGLDEAEDCELDNALPVEGMRNGVVPSCGKLGDDVGERFQRRGLDDWVYRHFG